MTTATDTPDRRTPDATPGIGMIGTPTNNHSKHNITDSEKTLVILPKRRCTWAKVACYVQTTQTSRRASNTVPAREETAVVSCWLLDSGVVW